MTISIKSPTSTTGSIQKNGSDVLTFDSSDNVTVVNNLSVSGTVSSTGAITFDGGTISGNVNFDSGTLYVDATNNRVGVGTTAPAGTLDVIGGRTFLSPNNETYALGVRYNSTTGAYYIGATNSATPDMVFSQVGGSERMRITNNGNVAIGSTTVSANAQLHVARGGSSLRIAHFENTRNISTDECVRSVLGSNCNNTSSYHYIATTGTDKYYLYGNGTYGTVSDENLKKNIETTRDGYLDDISNLRVVKYNWATDEDNTPKELGLIAQEVAQVFPNLVQEGPPQEDGNTYKQVKTSVLPFILLKALQEAITKIEDLETRIEALEQP